MTRRPDGSNWGDFGPADQHGRMNLITPRKRLLALAEARLGLTFCLSLPLDLPGWPADSRRLAPAFHPVMREGRVAFNLPLERLDPLCTDVTSDEAVTLYSHYSTHWDGFSHRGALFDADGDGVEEALFYNGHAIVDAVTGKGRGGSVAATAVGIEEMAETCVQGRGVLVDLERHCGAAGVDVGYDFFMQILEADGIVIEEGDILCLHTGLGRRIVPFEGRPDPELRSAGAALDGHDRRLLDWITDSGVAAIAADNPAVERTGPSQPGSRLCHRGSGLPLHEHCLFKLGIHLGELWYLSELSDWLRENGRSRFLLTAPPIRLPGASGAPVNPVATV